MESPRFCSVYMKDQVYFGGYPTAEWFEELVDFGITTFIDLTTPFEKRSLPFLYKFPHTICFPIRDNQAPSNPEMFRRFIMKLGQMIYSGKEKIYIHCKGGHGRSGLVIASLMCYLDGMTPHEALDRTTFIHSIRRNMKNKYRNIQCPDNYQQQRFIMELFSHHPTYRPNDKKKMSVNNRFS